MEIPDRLTCLLRNLCAGQEDTVKTNMEQQTGSKLGKEYAKAVYCHHVYLSSMQSTSCKMLCWINQKLESRLLGETSTSDMQMLPLLTAESREELECLLMGVEEGSEKTGLKLNIQKAKITAFGPITSWQILGKKWKQETNFLSLGSKITADSDCSHEIKRCLILVRTAITNLDSVLKSRDNPFANKGLYS